MYKPNCKEPLLLVNKYAITLFQNGYPLFLRGVLLNVNSYNANHLPLLDWLDSARSYSEMELDASYVLLESRREPLFLFVPCMKCELCKHSKQVDIINRTILESMTWDCPPFFFTLTYDNEHLPPHGELCYKDVQNFFKRLRIRWTRKGFKHDIRYLVSGEYGHKFGRPHYHVILFNNPYQCSELDYFKSVQLSNDIFESWNKCKRFGFDFGQCKGGAAPYATKYLLKPCNMQGHWIKPFVRMSAGRRGTLGSIFFDKYIPYLRQNPNINYIDFVDKQGNYGYMMLSKTFSKRVYPSPSASVPARKKEFYRQLISVLMQLQRNGVSFDSLLSLSEQLRPSKHVRNSFSFSKDVKRMTGFCVQWYRKRLSKLLSDLAFELSDFEEVPQSYIDTYYLHKDSFLPCEVVDKAQKIDKIKEDISVVLDKCKL